MQRLAVFSLFLFTIIVVVQCAPNSNNMYETLVKWTTLKKCTYLQNTSLLREDLRFLQECGNYDVVSTADPSRRYDLEKMHCLLYYDTFVALCAQGNEEVVMKIISEAALKTVNTKNVSDVCVDLRRFYQFDNESKIGKALKKNTYCGELCTDSDDSVMKPCSYSALMANVLTQLASQNVRQMSDVTSSVQKSQFPPAPTGKGVETIIKNFTYPVVANQSVPVMKIPVEHGVPNSGPALNSAVQDSVNQNPPPPLPQAPQPIEPMVEKAVHLKSNQNIPKQDDPTQLKKVETVLNIGTNSIKGSTMAISEKLSTVAESVAKAPTETVSKKVVETTDNEEEVNLEVQSPNKKPEHDVNKEPVSLGRDEEVQVKSVQVPSTTKAADKSDEVMVGNYEEDSREDLLENEQSTPIVREGKPRQTSKDEEFNGVSINDDDLSSNDSYFFSYFMMFCILFVMGYVGYHNKQKILALVLEGRRGRRQPRRRPNSANYHKLDSNLEEAVTSSCDKTTSNVIY